MKEQLQTTQQLKELCTIIDSDDDNNSMMASSRRLRQVLPDATEYKEEAFHYRPKSKREDDGRGRTSVTKGSRGSSSRQLVVYGKAANSSSSRRHSRSIDKTRQHHRSRSAANYKKYDDDADRRLNGNSGDNRDHQLKQHSSSSRHHERTRRPPSSEEQSFSSFNTTSTHPSTSNGDDLTADVDYDDYEDGYGQYTAYESKGPSSRASSRSSSSSRRKRRSCSPTKSRSRSSRSSSSRQHHHHHTHKDEHRSSYSPVRSRRPPRRPSPENYHLRSSFASHGSQRSSRTLPTSSSSSHHHSSKSAALMRRRSSDDLRALEADDLRAVERTKRSSNRRSGHHRKKSSSSRRKEEPAVDTTVNVRVSRDVKNSSSHSNGGSSSRIIDGKTPQKHNHSKSKKKKNSIDLTIDDNGQGTFQVVTSSSSTTTSTPLQFDIQIDEVNSSYLIQTSLGLLHHIREVHSPNTNILRTLTYWNQNFERDEVELGYHRGELGIVSMSSKDTKVVPVPDGVKAKSSTFSNSQDVVLMILTGSYHGGKASSFEKDDVFIKELELFVTDSLWCYLRLHGLMEESSQQQDQDGGDLGNGHADECAENIRNGSRKNLRADTKSDKKKERVLSRVFKRVIGE
mmetsp:Transcript_30849/g.52731  ORF Transcript_30849/g.52731 Transcript_30849/m.52731 type:complete len:625 (+) Transcript_30849:56-1930(+)